MWAVGGGGVGDRVARPTGPLPETHDQLHRVLRTCFGTVGLDSWFLGATFFIACVRRPVPFRGRSTGHRVLRAERYWVRLKQTPINILPSKEFFKSCFSLKVVYCFSAESAEIRPRHEFSYGLELATAIANFDASQAVVHSLSIKGFIPVPYHIFFLFSETFLGFFGAFFFYVFAFVTAHRAQALAVRIFFPANFHLRGNARFFSPWCAHGNILA